MALEHRQTMTVEEYFLLERTDPDARYEGIDPEEDFSLGEENEVLPGR